MNRVEGMKSLMMSLSFPKDFHTTQDQPLVNHHWTTAELILRRSIQVDLIF